jgi:hypothetical protein
MGRLSLPVLASLAALYVASSSAPGATLSEGTRLEVRLSVPTGSRISRAGDHIEAIVISPVFIGECLLVPQGAAVSGIVENVKRLGLGFKHRTAAIGYRFTMLQFPDGTAAPVETRVVQVETAKERVNAQGVIGGIHPTANLSASFAFYGLPFLFINPEFSVPALGVKFLIARSPDPEIYFPRGTELILQLTASAYVPNPRPSQDRLAPLSAAEIADVHRILAKLPEQRTDRGPNHPSDLVNILFIGTRDSIDRAFEAAGWSGAQRSSMLSIYRMYHCMVQRMGYSMAPMGNLTLNGVAANAEYQKSLNTFSKRHHLRLWKQGPGNAWLSAATEDVGYTLRSMHLTHATDPLIDNERAKVLNDLVFTGCVDATSLMKRVSSERDDQGDHSIQTDGKIAVIRMNDCQSPRSMVVETAKSGPHRRPRSVQALAALGNDLIRNNPVSLALNTVKELRNAQGTQASGPVSASALNPQKTESLEGPIQTGWMRPSVLNATLNRE